MGCEVDLLANYPKANREARFATKDDRRVAKRFGKQFFDGERRHGYGGYRYDPKYWKPVVQSFIDWYGRFDSVLDVGCAKGFMLHDFRRAMPWLKVSGIDISGYAVTHAVEGMRPFLEVGCASELPYLDKEFDIVVSINTIHNLDHDTCIKALQEIQRVGHDAFITVDAYRNQAEKERMLAWNLTAETILHVDGWKELFDEAGYTGDFNWFIP